MRDLLDKLYRQSQEGQEVSEKKKGKPGEATVYHKRVYLEMSGTEGLREAMEAAALKGIGKDSVPFEWKGKVNIGADQASGTLVDDKGEEHFMDVNWEVLGEDVEDVTVKGNVVSTEGEPLDKDNIEMGWFTLEVEECDAMQKFYTKEGPDMFKNWAKEEGIKVTKPITVKYVGELPNINESVAKVANESETEEDMKKPKEGCCCKKCGKDATVGEYSVGKCDACGGEIVAECECTKAAKKAGKQPDTKVKPLKDANESVDHIVNDTLKELIMNKNTRMKVVGNNTWLVTTNVDEGGIAKYDTGA